ncbi:hypothetical protein VaNZ11_007746 [Volvox africanus]|uniref:Uncharacterized protein n=1 Tax=Volvox africanus TaxID=51714 RepID=A0ABQ5S3I1_9CHLO|nr:hypothetical protein VaNZ11_007746 [Volvox africanus]
MPPVLDDGLPPHLHRTVQATLNGKRDVFKPPPRKQAPSLSIPLTPADLDLESGPLPASGASSLYGEGSRSGPLGDASSAWNSLTHKAASVRGGRAPSLEQLVDSPPSGPNILSAARLVGSAWVRQQEREWYRGQLAKRGERVNAEAERLFLTTIGPLGMSMNIWRKKEHQVEGVALRNVMREEALELHRLRLEEWNPRLTSQSATAAVQAAVATTRENSTASSAATSTAAAASVHGDPEDTRSSTAPGGRPAGRRRCMSALPHRYMETDMDRTRIRKALDKLAAKHAAPPTSGTETTAPAPDTAASPGQGMPRGRRAGPEQVTGGSGGEGGVGGNDTAAPTSPLQLLRSLRARREARWLSETPAMAARVSAFMEVESPASPRVAAGATAGHRASAAPRVPLRAAGPPRTPHEGAATLTSLTLRPASGHGTGAGMGTGTGTGTGSGAPGDGGVSFSRAASLSQLQGSSPLGSPQRQQQTLRQQEELELAQLPPDKATLAVKLVDLYEDSCRKYRLHAEPSMCSALRRSCAAVPGEPRSHSLELVALTLTNRESAAALAEVLTHCTHVTAVTLDRCAVGVEAMGVILPALWVLPLKRLTTISMEFPPPTWPLLQRALGRPTVWGAEATWWLSLRHLALTGNGLADQGLCALVEVLTVMPHLQSLALRQCGISDLSAPRLERLLVDVSSLRELDLGYNNLGSKALGALARGLPKAKELRRLSLSWNSIGNGVAQLCWTVMRLGPRHCRLEELDLAGTDLVAEDLFALAAILRTWRKTSVRQINLSHNNLVGVAGQCLLRHLNHLMPAPSQQQQQQQDPNSNNPATSAECAGDASGPVVDTPSPTGPAVASPTSGASFRSALEAAGGPGLGGNSGGGSKPLVPILKVPGGGPPAGARPDSPVKRLTINPTPQAAAPPPSTAAAPTQPEDPLSTRPSSTSLFSNNVEAAVAAAPAAFRSAGARGGGARGGGSGGGATADQEPMMVITTGCIVQPCLAPGAKLLVHPDGRPLAPTYSDDYEDGGIPARTYGGLTDRDRERLQEREREREQERERARERERERERRLGAGSTSRISSPSQTAGSHPSSDTSGTPAAAAIAAAATGVRGSVSGRLSPGPRTAKSQSQAASGPGGGEVRGAAAEVVVEPSGPHALHHALFDLSLDLPDREVAALLVEHEVEARRHGYLSAFKGVKWRGEVCKRDGVDLSPFDPVFLGWTHSLPQEGRLELLVAALPAQLCAWLANPRLHCNAEQS